MFTARSLTRNTISVNSYYLPPAPPPWKKIIEFRSLPKFNLLARREITTRDIYTRRRSSRDFVRDLVVEIRLSRVRFLENL